MTRVGPHELSSTAIKLDMLACRYCGYFPAHAVERCPRVTAVEYHPDGRIKRIEFAGGGIEP